jgi:hypothetical protein
MSSILHRATGQRATERIERSELVDDLGDLLPTKSGHGGGAVVELAVAAGTGDETAVFRGDDEQAVSVAEHVMPATVGHKPHDQREQ